MVGIALLLCRQQSCLGHCSGSLRVSPGCDETHVTGILMQEKHDLNVGD